MTTMGFSGEWWPAEGPASISTASGLDLAVAEASSDLMRGTHTAMGHVQPRSLLR